MAGILITRPNHDLITTYISQWSEFIIAFAKSKSHVTYDLFGKKADRKTFEHYLVSNKPSFLFLNGHGSSDVICGYRDEVLLDNASDSTLIQGKIIYARSCNAGENLGNTLVTKGVVAFVGYKKSFSIAMQNKFAVRPKEDPLARFFLEPSNLIASTIIKGNTVQEAYQRSMREMKKTLSEMISSNIPNKKDYAFALYNNMISQVVIGNKEAKIPI
mgnify:CR=1 FL=1